MKLTRLIGIINSGFNYNFNRLFSVELLTLFITFFNVMFPWFWFTVITNFFSCVLVYDVTRRDTFTNLSDVWAKEVELYSTNQHCVKMLVGNKVDIVSFIFSISFTFYYKLTET